MSVRMGLGAPPARETAATEDTGKLDVPRDDEARTKLSNWLPAHRVRYLRKLSAETGIQQRDLLVEAINMLETKYGRL